MEAKKVFSSFQFPQILQKIIKCLHLRISYNLHNSYEVEKKAKINYQVARIKHANKNAKFSAYFRPFFNFFKLREPTKAIPIIIPLFRRN